MSPEAQPRRESPGEITRLHERIDDVFHEIQKLSAMQSEMREAQAEVISSCTPCKAKVASLDLVVNGNGVPGMKERIGALERGRTDTFTIRSFGLILAAVGSFVGALAAAIGGLVAAVASRGPVVP